LFAILNITIFRKLAIILKLVSFNIFIKVLNNGNGNGRGRVKVFAISAVTGVALQIAVVTV
jgi:hypothetical protein